MSEFLRTLMNINGKYEKKILYSNKYTSKGCVSLAIYKKRCLKVDFFDCLCFIVEMGISQNPNVRRTSINTVVQDTTDRTLMIAHRSS